MRNMVGDMFLTFLSRHAEGHDDYLGVTTNAYITKYNSLVMGRGAANQLRKLSKSIEYDFGRLVREKTEFPDKVYGPAGVYGVLFKEPFFIFQVKLHYSSDAKTDLIRTSTNELKKVAEQNPDRVYHLNYPGIGYGNLTVELVEDIIRVLPDNVVVWRNDI